MGHAMHAIHLHTRSGAGVLRGLVLLLSLSSSACTVGPDYQPPQSVSPQRWGDWHSGPEALRSTRHEGERLRDQAWWKVFGDPVLDDLQARAMQANPELHGAILRFAQARMQRRIVSSAYLPEVTLEGGVSRQKQSLYGMNNRLLEATEPGNREALEKALGDPFTLYQAGFDASWEPDLWGQVGRSVEAARAEIGMAAAALDDTLLSISSEVARSYIEVRTAQRQIRLLEEDIRMLEERLRLVRVRAGEGLTDELYVERQKAELEALRGRLPAWQASETEATNRIAVLLGERPGALARTLEAKPGNVLERALPDFRLGVPSELVRQRPDIRAAEQSLHRATADIGIAKAALYPSIALGARFGYESYRDGKFGEWGSRAWSIGPTLDLPLFDAGRRRTVVRLRELEQQEAAVTFQRTVLGAWQEVDDALSRYHAEYQRNLHMRDKAASSRQAYEWTQVKYAQGQVDFLEEIDAQRTSMQAQRELIDSEALLRTQLIALYKTLGG